MSKSEVTKREYPEAYNPKSIPQLVTAMRGLADRIVGEGPAITTMTGEEITYEDGTKRLRVLLAVEYVTLTGA